MQWQVSFANTAVFSGRAYQHNTCAKVMPADGFQNMEGWQNIRLILTRPSRLGRRGCQMKDDVGMDSGDDIRNGAGAGHVDRFNRAADSCGPAAGTDNAHTLYRSRNRWDKVPANKTARSCYQDCLT